MAKANKPGRHVSNQGTIPATRSSSAAAAKSKHTSAKFEDSFLAQTLCGKHGSSIPVEKTTVIPKDIIYSPKYYNYQGKKHWASHIIQKRFYAIDPIIFALALVVLLLMLYLRTFLLIPALIFVYVYSIINRCMRNNAWTVAALIVALGGVAVLCALVFVNDLPGFFLTLLSGQR